ncbi:hypothetical protein [Streptomyces sp. NPDC056987]
MGTDGPAPADDWNTGQPVSATPQGDNYGTVIPLGSDWGVA